MGITKSDLFTNEQNEVANLLKAIAHPARIAIMEYLIRVENCICGDIVNELPLAQPTVSQHLKELKSGAIIKGSIEGTSVCYCIDKETISRIHAYFSLVLAKLESRNDQCC